MTRAVLSGASARLRRFFLETPVLIREVSLLKSLVKYPPTVLVLQSFGSHSMGHIQPANAFEREQGMQRSGVMPALLFMGQPLSTKVLSLSLMRLAVSYTALVRVGFKRRLRLLFLSRIVTPVYWH